MKEYVARDKLLQDISETVIFTVREGAQLPNAEMRGANKVIDRVKSAKSADVVEVVRCKDCIHGEPFDKNCTLNTKAYLHCRILRGEEVNNVWHKYKKYYKDYSVVDRDGFCDEGVRKGEGE